MIGKFTPIIAPDAINVLCQDSVFVQQGSHKPEFEPDFKLKQSFWSKVGSAFRKIADGLKYAISVATTAAILLNAFARYKNATSPAAA